MSPADGKTEALKDALSQELKTIRDFLTVRGPAGVQLDGSVGPT